MFLPTCNHFYDLRNQVALLPLLQDQHIHDLFFRVWTWVRFENGVVGSFVATFVVKNTINLNMAVKRLKSGWDA